jgi:type VI secretion system ImpH/TssG family protein
MATAHWRTGFTVADLYTRPDAGWSFYQLVRVLLAQVTHAETTETGAAAAELPVLLNKHFRFRAAHQADFPAGEIRAIKQKQGPYESRFEITSVGNHISGFNGPLPDGLTDMLVEDLRSGEGALSEFLDLFNHRLQALRYLFRSQTDNSLAFRPAGTSDVGRMALALSGNLSPLHQRLYQQSPSTLLGMAGSLANRRMSLPTIQGLFSAVLGVELCAMENLVGRWLKVDEEDHIKLGQANHRLGGQATLGTRIWDQQAAIGLEIGPLSGNRLRALLPGGDEYPELLNLLKWITDCRCDCRVTLISDESLSAAVCLSSNTQTGGKLNMLSCLGQKNEPARVTFMVDLVDAPRE